MGSESQSKLPKRELEICGRLQRIRLALKWGMPDFAKEFGITRDRLASYEYGRAPLRYGLGRRICERFGIAPRWLVTGRKPYYGFTDFDAIEREQGIPPKVVFSQAYDKWLRQPFENKLSVLEIALGIDFEELMESDELLVDARWPLNTEKASEQKSLQLHFGLALPHIMDNLPADLQKPFLESLVSAAAKFMRTHRAEIGSRQKTSKAA